MKSNSFARNLYTKQLRFYSSTAYKPATFFERAGRGKMADAHANRAKMHVTHIPGSCSFNVPNFKCQ